MRIFDALVAASLVLSTSFSDAFTPSRRPVIPRGLQGVTKQLPIAYNFTMPIDHFTPSDTRTYNNEYWVNNTFYKPGGPVFLFDLGETGYTIDSVAMTLSSSESIQGRLMQKYGALGVAWQHRFYGYSVPFPLDENRVPVGGAKAFQYMTQEQAMEDVAYFARNAAKLQEKLHIEGDNVLHPDKTPWIFVGGSYPGMRAAMMRIRNPDIIYASWASSAPLQPDLDGSAYFNAALRGLWSNCTSDFHKTVKWMDQQFDAKNQTAIKFIQERLWLANALATNNSKTLNSTAAYELSFKDMAEQLQAPLNLGDPTWAGSNFQSAGPVGVRAFCDLMETYDAGSTHSKTTIDNYDKKLMLKKSPPSGGIFDMYGPERAFDAFWAAYVWMANPDFAAMGDDTEKAVKTEQDLMTEWGNIAWSWQNLYELGNFLGWSPDYERFHKDDSVLSKYYTWQDNRDSNIATIVGLDPKDAPQTSSYWADYGGWGMQPSNVMFTDGYWDPWRSFSPGSQEYEMGKPVRNYTTETPKCGLPLDGNKLYGQLYTSDTSAHCSDLGSLSDPNTSRSLGLFMLALRAWLPCFHADD